MWACFFHILALACICVWKDSSYETHAHQARETLVSPEPYLTSLAGLLTDDTSSLLEGVWPGYCQAPHVHGYCDCGQKVGVMGFLLDAGGVYDVARAIGYGLRNMAV